VKLTGFPRGLLDLIGSNNFGDNPNEMSPVIVPTIDLTDLYMATRIVSRAGIGSGAPAAGVNRVLLTEVPQGKLWALYSAAASFSAEAGVTADVGLALTVPADNAYRTYLTNWVAVAAGLTKAATAQFAPMFLPSGSRLGVYLQNVTGVPTVASSVECNLIAAEFSAGG